MSSFSQYVQIQNVKLQNFYNPVLSYLILLDESSQFKQINFYSNVKQIIYLIIMKSLQNPTTFFFKQAEQVTDNFSKQIHDFANKLLNKDKCQLCKLNYDILLRVPRIMIHCGHTFCTPCLKQFYMYFQSNSNSRNRRVRCPMCLKLVKQLDTIQRLPINHTVFTYLVQKDKQICQKSNIKSMVTDASKTLFAQFQRAQKQGHMKQNPQKIDPDSGLPFCVFHGDRVQHFYCSTHSSAGCRVCSQIGHSKVQCKVVDLYEIEDPNQLVNMLSNNSQNHLLSSNLPNPTQLQPQSSDKKDIIVDQSSGIRYIKQKNGKLVPILGKYNKLHEKLLQERPNFIGNNFQDEEQDSDSDSDSDDQDQDSDEQDQDEQA